MDLSVLECALISQLAYQTPKYVAAAWRQTHGGQDDHAPPLQSDALDTQLTSLNQDHVTILKDAPTAPEFSDDATTDGDCYTFVLKREHSPAVLVIAYRGTSSWQDTLCDAEACMRPWGDGMVHCGFYGQFEALRKHTDPRVAAWSDDILCVGHSLGAALSSLATALYSKSCAVHLRTFGSPRVGDSNFAASVTTHARSVIRCKAGSDVIPKVPLPIVYRHTGAETHVGLRDPHPDVPLMTDIKDHDLGKSYIPSLRDPKYIAPGILEYAVGFWANKLMQVRLVGTWFAVKSFWG